jgi:hypothetical protein
LVGAAEDAEGAVAAFGGDHGEERAERGAGEFAGWREGERRGWWRIVREEDLERAVVGEVGEDGPCVAEGGWVGEGVGAGVVGVIEAEAGDGEGGEGEAFDVRGWGEGFGLAEEAEGLEAPVAIGGEKGGAGLIDEGRVEAGGGLFFGAAGGVGGAFLVSGGDGEDDGDGDESGGGKCEGAGEGRVAAAPAPCFAEGADGAGEDGFAAGEAVEVIG